MIRCPLCASRRVVVVVSPNRRAFCTVCDARWVQDGVEQRDVHAARAPRNPAREARTGGTIHLEDRFAVDWA